MSGEIGRDGAPDGAADRPGAEVEAVLEDALRLGEGDRWEEMADRLDAALDDHPENPFLLCWLGVAEREMGLETQAYERFKECLAQQPADPHVLATAGNAVAAFDDPDAETALRTAAMLGPRLALARWMYGAYLAREGMVERALEELEAALELDPDNPTIHFEHGVALALDERWDAAVDSIHEAVRMEPEDGWARVLLGLVLLRLERYAEAAGDLAEGARMRPDDVEAQLLAALAAVAADHLDLGFEMLERARLQAEGMAETVVLAVEDRLDGGPDPARRFLVETLAPTALRDRLMTRP